MPNIVEYSAPPGESIRPTDMPETAYQLVGRRAGGIGNETASMIRQGGDEQRLAANAMGRALDKLGGGIETVGSAVDTYEAQHEILGGLPRLAHLHDQLDQLHTQLLGSADPFDPDTRSRYQEAVTSVLQEFPGSFNTAAGRTWATRQAAQAGTEIYRQGVAADSLRAKSMAVTSLTETTNTLAGLAARNPAMIDTALGMLPETFQALEANNPTLKGLDNEMTQQIGSHIVVSGIRGAMQANPAAGWAIMQSGKYDRFISDKDRVALTNVYQHTAGIEEHTAKAGELAERKAENDAINQATLALHGSTLTDHGQALPRDYWQNYDRIVNMPGAERHLGLIDHIATEGNRLEAQETTRQKAAEKGENVAQAQIAKNTTDIPALEDVLGRQVNDDTVLQPGAILRRPGLSPADKQWLIQQDSPQARAALGRLSGVLDYAKQLIAGPDPASRTEQGMTAYSQAARSIVQAYQAGQRQGLTADQLLSPDSKDYVGRTDKLQAFVASPVPTIGVNKAGPRFLHPFNMPHPASTGAHFRTDPNAKDMGVPPPSGAWPFPGPPQAATSSVEQPALPTDRGPGAPRPPLHEIFSENPADEVAKDVANEPE